MLFCPFDVAKVDKVAITLSYRYVIFRLNVILALTNHKNAPFHAVFSDFPTLYKKKDLNLQL